MEQLLLFQESREDRLEKEVKSLREQSEKVRKKLFAENGELKRKYTELYYEYEMLKIAICKKV